MKLFPVTIGICMALAATSAWAGQIPRKVVAEYQAGLRGDAGANGRAMDQLGTLVKQDPADALAAAYLGASETAHALYVERPWAKLKFSERGLARLEKALHMLSKDDLKSVPGQLSVHDRVETTAGCTFVAVPPMFHRFYEGYSLLQKLVASKSFAEAGDRHQAHAYLCAAEAAVAAKDRQKAKAYIADLIEVAPKGPLRARATQLQAKLGE